MQSFRQTLRTFGWSDTLTYTAAWLLRKLSLGRATLRKYYFVAQPVQHPAPASRPPGGATRLYVADQADAVIAQSGRPGRVIADRFAQQARCVVAEKNGELAGFIWLCPRLYREDEVRCDYRWTPGAAAVWDFDVYVAPPFRLGRLFARLWEHAHALLSREGVQWTLSRIDAFNARSLAVHRKLGAQELASGWFLSFGTLQVAAFNVAPYLHLSLGGGRRPEVCLDLTSLAAPQPPQPVPPQQRPA